MRRVLASILVLAAVAFPLWCAASQTEGTIALEHTYAWGENMGWINFGPTNGDTYEGLVVTDSAVTGYAWSAAVGWINFSPTNSGQGVTNTVDGHLAGSAWIAARGWLSMNGVSINSSGKFTGVAGEEGGTVGRVSFDCSNCDVQTDWRPLSVRSNDAPPPSAPRPVGGGGTMGGPTGFGFLVGTPTPPTPATPPSLGGKAGSLGGNTQVATPAAVLTTTMNADPIAQFYGDIVRDIPALRADPNHVESYNKPLLVEPKQTGLIVERFAGGAGAAVEIPRNAWTGTLTVSITAQPFIIGAAAVALAAMGGVAFDVTAVDSSGNLVHAFDHPLKITLAVPESLQGRADIGVYWFDTSVNNWVAVPQVTFSGRTASFYVDHLTRFAILSGGVGANTIGGAAPQTVGAVGPLFLPILLVLVILYVVYRRYRQ